ncbi:PAS domain S-box protein [Methanolobus sp. WCC4]|uniref:PAS domain S-box protein n=1 Tax=Methanolobus sp. WCC4 TaxID=3125784 RepID=UPI0030F9E79B
MNGSDRKIPFKAIIEKDFNVVEVSPCASLMKKLEIMIPDIIVIDGSIHDPDTYEACQDVKFSDKYHFIPVIFTGPSLPWKHKVRLVESGADDYLEEAFDNEDTIAYLKALVDKRKNFKCLDDRHNELKKEVSGQEAGASVGLKPEDEDLFKVFFQQSAVGIARLTVEGNFQKVNERFCDIVGYSRDELYSMNFMDITYPDSSGIEEEMMIKVLSGETDSFEIEKRYVHKEGHIVWVRLYVNVIRDGSGDIKYAFAIVADISARKKTESLLYESEAIFRSMYESSGIGITRMSVKEKRILQANDAFCKMLGYTEEELVGKLLKDISYFEDLPKNIELQNQLVAGDISSIQMEKRYTHKDGHPVWGYLNANLIFDEAGNPLYYIGNVIDLSEMKKSRQLLEQSEEKYRTYVDYSPYPIFVADASGKYVDVNPAACIITGYTMEEMLEMNITDLCAPEYLGAAREHFRAVKGQGYASGELLFIKKDGTPFFMQVEAVILDEDTFMGICVDTTEHKMAEKLLIEAKLLAEDASMSKSEFVANISHELRTPLNIVIGYSDILLSEMSGKLNEKQMKYANSVKNAGSNLLEIVNSLIYIAEIEAGDWNVHLSQFEILPIIDEMRKVTRTSTAKKNISVDFKVKDDIDHIVADRSKFLLILHHLIGNSIKFTPDSGSINILVERSGTDLRASVTDTGIGIPEEKQEQLFDPFVQIDWSHARRYSGVGIGLSLVKELVEMHGGSIGLESKVGEGTRIWFTIPQEE